MPARTYATVVHALDAAAARVPGREALVCGADRLTYREYHACVAVLAAELVALGARGQRVAMVLGNSVDLCIASFAIHAAGAQAVPLNPIYTRHELEPILVDAEPIAVFYDATSRAAVETLVGDLHIAHGYYIGGDGRRLTDPRDATDAPLPQPLPAPTDLATVQYTGGTTGRSKGAELTHDAIAVNLAQRAALAPTADGARLLAVLPMFHVYGVAMCLHNAVCARATLVIVAKYRPDTVIDTLIAERITELAGSPTLFTGVMGHAEFATARFPDLKVSYSGGAALPEEVLRKWETATGTYVLEGYGLSEAGPVVSFTPVSRVRKAGSVGVPVPDCEVEIVDVDTGLRPLPAGERGEIRVKGPQIMRGYRNLAEATAQTLRAGWLYTGDIGEFDADGYLYIRDRKKDLVIVGGYNVYPREVEEVLYLHPAVREVAVVGQADSYRGEVVKAVVVLRDGASADADTLIEHCRARLARYKLPAVVQFVPELPKTGAGKIDKKRLRA